MRIVLSSLAAILTTVIVIGLSADAHAHHGWGWTSDKEFSITGKVVEARLGNPHGEVTVEVDGDEWLVEVGQPWRNERAGLSDEHFSEGREVTIEGHRAEDEDEHRMKAIRVIIDGENHDLYPDRVFD